MSAIVDIISHEVLGSHSNPTIECDVLLESGVVGRTAMPSGVSTGSRETVKLRDGDEPCCLGKGVLKIVEHINAETSEAIMGLDTSEQTFLDRTLIDLNDTENKSRLGANAMLMVLMAAAKAAVEKAGLPLYRYFGGSDAMQVPVPIMSIVNGGVRTDNSLDIQEFMVTSADQSNFYEVLRHGAEISHALKKTLADEGMSMAVGDEGGFTPNFASNEGCSNTISSVIEQAGYKVGEGMLLALDYVTSESYEDGKYHPEDEGLRLSPEDFASYPANLADKFPTMSIEDGTYEGDRVNWKALTEKFGKKVQLVGDDLFVMNTKILKKGIEKGIVSSTLIKINQIGALTGTFAAIEMAKRTGYTVVTPRRSGKTEDSTVVDVTVGMNVGQIKTGPLSRLDRIAKYSQLLRIEEDLGDIANYLGRSAFYNLR